MQKRTETLTPCYRHTLKDPEKDLLPSHEVATTMPRGSRIIMNDKELLREMRRVVLENADSELVSLYVIGSFLSKEMVESSDIDLVGVMKSSFDFSKEVRINKALNATIRSRQRIDLGTMSHDEFFGGPQKGSLTKHIELRVFLNFLKRAQLLYGRRINFDRVPVKPALPEEELKYHIKVFNEYKAVFRKKDRISADFSFKDFIKIVFYIADLELQLIRNLTPRRSYSEIVKALQGDRAHIVHYSMRLRRKKTISYEDRQSWLNLAERYVAQIKAEFKT
jgi:predicted nucleotidyltransferase